MKLRKFVALALAAAMILQPNMIPVRAADTQPASAIPFIISADATYTGTAEIMATLNINGQTVVIDGDLVQSADIHLNGGDLRVTGNWCQKGGTFYTEGGQIIVAGTYEQQGGLLMTGSSEEGSDKGGVIEIQKDAVLSGKGITGKYGTTNFKGNLDQHKDAAINAENGAVTVAGNLEQKANISAGNGVITVAGNLHQYNDTTLSIEKGNVTVDGNYTMAEYGEDDNGNTVINSVSSALKMTEEEGYFTVGGDYLINSSLYDYYNVLTAGTLELKGNFTQMQGNNGTTDSFNAKDKHRVIFSGTGKQTISFENPKSSGFNTLLETKNKNVDLTAARIRNIGKDVTVANFVQYGDLSLEGGTLTVTNDLTQNGNISVGNGQLKVNGNMLQQEGTFQINSGVAMVKGNYTMAMPVKAEDGTTEYQSASAALKMEDDNGRFVVGGDYYVNSSLYDYYNRLTAGTLELKGNFTQRQGSDGTTSNFNAKEKHKVVFSGNKEQVIDFENPTSSGFNILYATPNHEVKLTSARIRTIGDKVTVESFVQYGDLNLGSYQLNVLGDMTQYGNVNVETGTLKVDGNYFHLKDTLTVGAGKVTVGKDYVMAEKTIAEDGTVTYGSVSAALKMENAAGYMRVWGDYYVNSTLYDYYNRLTAGTLEIKGNFKQMQGSDGTTTNFNSKEDHKVYISGRQALTVEFENPKNSGFNILSGADNAKADLLSARITTLEQDAVIGSFVQNDPLDLNGHKLTVCGDMTQYGDISLNGGELVVEGDYLHETGTLNIQDGTLTVKGDYRMQKKVTDEEGKVTYEAASAALKMENAEGHFTVEGDYYVQSNLYDYYNRLTAGTLELKGNFTQMKGSDGTTTNFNAKEAHRVIFSGDKLQTVTFENAGNDAGFNILWETKNSNVAINKGRIKTIATEVTLRNFSQYGTLSLDGGKLTVTEGLIQYGDINLGSGELNVYGDMSHQNGTFQINSGKAMVMGNYTMAATVYAEDGSVSTGSANACLKMEEEAGYFTVCGDYYVDSKLYDYYNRLTAGTLELKGNFTQKKGSDGTTTAFNSKDKHRIVLSGNGKQVIDFENAGASGFNILTGTDNKQADLVSARINALEEDCMIGSFTQYGTLDLGGHRFGVNGDMTELGDINVNGGALIVEGNYLHTKGTLQVQNGDVTVRKDYRMQKLDTDEEGNQVYVSADAALKMENAEGTFTVEGDYYVQSNLYDYYNRLTAGTIILKGNFTQLEGSNGTTSNFNAKDEHRVILFGTKGQTIYFENPESSGFNILYETPNPEAEITSARIYGIGEDVTLASFTQYGNLSLAGGKLTVTDDLTEYGNINVNDGALTVDGNFYYKSGNLSIGTGTFINKEIEIKDGYLNQPNAANEEKTVIYNASSGMAGQPSLSGDINADNTVDIADALRISQYDADLTELSAEAIAAGDVNGDGVVDIADALLISQYDAGMIVWVRR